MLDQKQLIALITVAVVVTAIGAWRRFTRKSGIRYRLAEKEGKPLKRCFRPITIRGFRLFRITVWLFEREIRPGFDIRDRSDGSTCFPPSWGWDERAAYQSRLPGPVSSATWTKAEGAAAAAANARRVAAENESQKQEEQAASADSKLKAVA